MRLEEILCHSQSSLKKRLAKELRKQKYTPVNQKGFLYAPGQVPVLLVAHLDTVHSMGVKTILRSDDGNILMSPQGIGGDDRAGVYMVMELINSYKCHVLFCEDEEVGAIGARKFVLSGISPKVNYILEFDRKGATDAVFYDCCNKDFIEFICGFGFSEDFGSFSDISVLAPALRIAAANMSAGYFSAHTTGEYINLSIVRTNIKKVKKILAVTPTPFFEYIEKPRFFPYRGRGRYMLPDEFNDGFEYGLLNYSRSALDKRVPEKAGSDRPGKIRREK